MTHTLWRNDLHFDLLGRIWNSIKWLVFLFCRCYITGWWNRTVKDNKCKQSNTAVNVKKKKLVIKGNTEELIKCIYVETVPLNGVMWISRPPKPRTTGWGHKTAGQACTHYNHLMLTVCTIYSHLCRLTGTGFMYLSDISGTVAGFLMGACDGVSTSRPA